MIKKNTNIYSIARISFYLYKLIKLLAKILSTSNNRIIFHSCQLANISNRITILQFITKDCYFHIDSINLLHVKDSPVKDTSNDSTRSDFDDGAFIDPEIYSQEIPAAVAIYQSRSRLDMFINKIWISFACSHMCVLQTKMR